MGLSLWLCSWRSCGVMNSYLGTQTLQSNWPCLALNASECWSYPLGTLHLITLERWIFAMFSDPGLRIECMTLPTFCWLEHITYIYARQSGITVFLSCQAKSKRIWWAHNIAFIKAFIPYFFWLCWRFKDFFSDVKQIHNKLVETAEDWEVAQSFQPYPFFPWSALSAATQFKNLLFKCAQHISLRNTHFGSCFLLHKKPTSRHFLLRIPL